MKNKKNTWYRWHKIWIVFFKNKNIRILGNKPLVGWILSSAKKSKYINRLVVSTDNEICKNIIRKYGAKFISST